jgi:hypothetical protein
VLGGKALGTLSGDGVSVIDMAVLRAFELNLAVVVETSEMRPSSAMDSMAARSRFATPNDLSGAGVPLAFNSCRTAADPIHHSTLSYLGQSEANQFTVFFKG